uniref:Uncharacterized protein n=1 Tax=Nelumbo nucifera TaxID=4432 RepID=A0A822XX80_NELNU|nr:TPA_asm: hypothetical protein HUJ06_026086 [Nelumbo nucifera]
MENLPFDVLETHLFSHIVKKLEVSNSKCQKSLIELNANIEREEALKAKLTEREEEFKAELEVAGEKAVAAFKLLGEFDAEKLDFAIPFIIKGFRLCKLLSSTIPDYSICELKVEQEPKELILAANVESEPEEEENGDQPTTDNPRSTTPSDQAQ